MNPLGWVIVALMVLSLLIIPLGWPGLWILVALVGLGAVLGEVSAGILLLALAVAGLAELLELLIVRRMSLRWGGSSRAFWGAVIGGTIGVLVGLPVPVLGPVLAGIAGSFLGAALLAFHESRDLVAAGRVGWGVVLGRTLAAFVKVAAGLVILVVGGTAWIIA
jgi:uncharacterized protein YqgC (DUF456 family)